MNSSRFVEYSSGLYPIWKCNGRMNAEYGVELYHVTGLKETIAESNCSSR